MIEAALYFALGALCVSLLLFVILPIVSGRARRLAIHELERQAPVSLSEITAQKDQMRARFAVELNRQEKRADQLQVESQQHHVTAEKWRIFAERVEQEFEKLNSDYAGLKKKISSAEVNLEKQKEIAKSALKTMTGQEKKRLFELEDEVEELRSEKSAANVRFVSMQTELNNAQSRVAEMERHMPSLEELNLRKELKALAEDVSAFVKSTPVPAPVAPPAPVAFVPPPAPIAVVVPPPVPVAVAPPPAPADTDPSPAPVAITPSPTPGPIEPNVAVEPPASFVAQAETPSEQEGSGQDHPETDGKVSVLPAFLKPAAQRQSADPGPADAEPIMSGKAPPEPETDSSNVTALQINPAQTKEEPAGLQDTDLSASETLASETSGDGVQENTSVATLRTAETIADSVPINGKEVHLGSGNEAGGSGSTEHKSGERSANVAIASVKPVKQDKPPKSKKSGFASIVAAVSRTSKGPASSGASGKIKSGSVQFSGKMNIKNAGARIPAADNAELNGAKPHKVAPESTDTSPNDNIPSAKSRKKIVKFGKKVRRIKAANAS